MQKIKLTTELPIYAPSLTTARLLLHGVQEAIQLDDFEFGLTGDKWVMLSMTASGRLWSLAR